MMMMSRVLLAFFAFFASLWLALGSPIPQSEANLDRRTTHSGRGTWYHAGHGNCGGWNTDSDLVVAMSKPFYDRNGGSNCDQYVKITSNGKTAYGLMVDSCPGCGEGDLDMSPSLFERFASLDTGVISISWSFKPRGWKP